MPNTTSGNEWHAVNDRSLLKMESVIYFQCGSCKHSFESIGSLHKHLFEHIEDASYSFCGKTRTAFPKYEPIDAFTQTDNVTDVSNIISLSKSINRLIFWKCSSCFTTETI